MTATTGKRRKARELAMQMLFQADMGKQNPDEVRSTFWKARDEVEPDTRLFAEATCSAWPSRSSVDFRVRQRLS